MAIQWETLIEPQNYVYTDRLKVYKGWLVRCLCSVKDTVSICFVPDENHEWNPFSE